MGVHGIDLGTTYSCVAMLDEHGNPVIIRNQEDNADTLASAVFFESDSNVIVGSSAKEMADTEGERVVQFIKREIGKADARTYVFDGKTYTAVEISSLILSRLKQIVESQGGQLTDAVITCPAYFGLEERMATKKAGELAGIRVLNIINEPTAAALCYCARQFQEEKTIMVYDLGGGTFDVTVMKMSMVIGEDGQEQQQIRIIATGGNDRLGGADWDEILYRYLLECFCAENGLTEADLDPETLQLIRSSVEKTKVKLSSTEKTKVRVRVNGAPTTVEVTREKFEELTQGKVALTMGYVDHVMEDLARKGITDIDLVLLVGGSTFMPMIREAVEARFPGKVQVHDPNLSVAKGAAIYASMLVQEEQDDTVGGTGGSEGTEASGGTEEPGRGEGTAAGGEGTTVGVTPVAPPPIDVVDVLPRSFGPGVLNEDREYVIDNLAKIGQNAPADATKVYYTAADNMAKIVLRVFESISSDDTVVPCVTAKGEPQECDPSLAVQVLGVLEMELPPQTPAGAPIEVTFHVDMDGIHVTARNQTNGDVVDTTIRFASDVDPETSSVKGMMVTGEF